jgi:hypothetical protein
MCEKLQNNSSKNAIRHVNVLYKEQAVLHKEQASLVEKGALVAVRNCH